MKIEATFFDGKSARDHAAEITLQGKKLLISGAGIAAREWDLRRLHPIDPPTPGTPFRLSHDSHPGERLIIRDQAFIDALLREEPALRGGYTIRHFAHVIGWTVAGFAGLAAAGLAFFSFLPQHVAPLLPDQWRNETGKQLETMMVKDHRECTGEAGKAALGKMVLVLSNGNDLPPIGVKIYDLPIVNAFALSGGRVILTRELLKAADSPDEIAGVLAHEIGHVAHLHPEQQLVRIAGLQVLMSAFGGSSTMGDIAGNAAGLAALLSYTRKAEVEADSYARQTMVNARVDPMGLKKFFEKIIALEGKPAASKDDAASALNRIGDIFSSHPHTEDRINEIQPLPAGVTAVPSLTPEDWKALKAICS